MRQAKLTWEESIVSYLAKEGYDPFFGARPLKRLIQQEVVNLPSKELLEGSLQAHNKVKLKIDLKGNIVCQKDSF